MVNEALAAGVPLECVYALPGDPTAELAAEAGFQVVPVTDRVLGRLAPTDHPQGPVAVLPVPDPADLENLSILALWGVGDPGNVGALIRVARAFGLGVAVGPESADPWSPKCLRAGAGAQFHVPMGTSETVADLRSGGRAVVASVVRGGIAPWDMERGEMAILLGEEGRGLPDELVQGADERVTIPMTGGSESLNVAIAGALLAYELWGRPGGER